MVFSFSVREHSVPGITCILISFPTHPPLRQMNYSVKILELFSLICILHRVQMGYKKDIRCFIENKIHPFEVCGYCYTNERTELENIALGTALYTIRFKPCMTYAFSVLLFCLLWVLYYEKTLTQRYRTLDILKVLGN